MQTHVRRSTRLVLGNLASWTHSSCVVYPSPTFSPPEIIDAVIEEGCTALHGVPTHFLGVLEEAAKRGKGKADFKTLRTGIAAGSPIPIDLMKELIDKLNLVDLTVAYGMSMFAFLLSSHTLK
jgi:acyl-CoA synthetase (AMP-forming)/AMP-acid ligase II